MEAKSSVSYLGLYHHNKPANTSAALFVGKIGRLLDLFVTYLHKVTLSVWHSCQPRDKELRWDFCSRHIDRYHYDLEFLHEQYGRWALGEESLV